jgi:hypothetical protein
VTEYAWPTVLAGSEDVEIAKGLPGLLLSVEGGGTGAVETSLQPITPRVKENARAVDTNLLENT